MKKLLAALVVSVYIIPATLLVLLIYWAITKMAHVAFGYTLLAEVALALLLVIANLIAAVVSGFRKQPLPWIVVFVFQVSFIPFSIVNYILWSILAGFGMMLGPWGIPLMLPNVLVSVFIYAIMLAASGYAIAGLADLRRRNEITAGRMALHIICQLVVFLNVADSLFLAFKYRPKLKRGTPYDEHRTISHPAPGAPR